MIACNESHKLWHLFNFDVASLIHVKVVPRFLEISPNVILQHLVFQTFMSFQDLCGGCAGSILVHPEHARRVAFFCFLLKGIVFNHRFHEEVGVWTIVLGWKNACVDTNLQILVRLTVLRFEILLGMVNFLVVLGAAPPGISLVDAVGACLMDLDTLNIIR